MNIVVAIRTSNLKWMDSSSTGQSQSSTVPSSTSSSTPWPTDPSTSSSTAWPTPSRPTTTGSTVTFTASRPTTTGSTVTFTASRSTTTGSTFTPTPTYYSSSSTPSTPSFNKINILLARNVQLQATSSPGDYFVTITCDDPSILPYVRANVTEDSMLVVTATTDCDVTIGAYTYQAIHLDSVSLLSMTSYSYRGYELKLLSMGNSQIQIANIGYDLAEFTLVGNSTMEMSGKIGKLTITSRGKGFIDATRIETANVNATLAGVGSLRVKSTANMNLIVDGTGNLMWCSPKVQMDVTYDYRKKNIVYQC
ncbi:unnamed protein product [Adineta steineri]|uniref:Putative auto-transporter adhesin head GIN domain-containing protein n=1 Tax=Adineta steineri TaxID=433720 RepID=A0A818TKH2_9BILA|nr:unnamed protein product [Adineta steineri]CAF3685109.1 unnamed protein product [Adineta steineri]